MKLEHEQLARFEEDGYLFLPECFQAKESAVLRAAADEVYACDREEIVRESSGVARTAFAAHRYNEAFRRLGAHPRLIEPVMWRRYGVNLISTRVHILTGTPFLVAAL